MKHARNAAIPVACTVAVNQSFGKVPVSKPC